MTQHFLQTDNLATGGTYVLTYTAEDMAQTFGPEICTLLADGKTVRIGDRLICDLQAFVAAHRALPDAMTRTPLPVNLAARRAGVPQLQRV